MRKSNFLYLCFKSLLLVLFLLTNKSIYCKADTVDVWIIKINDKIVVRSNQMLIEYDNQPMQISISNYKPEDTLSICYWTDSGLEAYPWNYSFKDSLGVLITNFENPIDSTIRCIPSPCKEFTLRKNHISFSIDNLRQLLRKNKINKINVEFSPVDKNWQNPYLSKIICIISE